MAVDTPSIQIIVTLTDSDESKSAYSGAGVKVDDNDGFSRDSTFMTELEDTDEIQQDNFDEQEKLDQLEQLSDESEILNVESKGEMEKSNTEVEDKYVDNATSIEQA